jgi:hypothetical protein
VASANGFRSAADLGGEWWQARTVRVCEHSRASRQRYKRRDSKQAVQKRAISQQGRTLRPRKAHPMATSQKKPTPQPLPVAERPLPNPHKYPLRALQSILHRYLLLGGPAWLRLPSDFHPLASVAFHIYYFLVESYCSTLLCFLIPMYLLMTDRQLKRKQRVYGGRVFGHLYRFTEADLEQRPADRDALKRLGTDTLFHLIGDELRLLIRLLRAAQQIFRRAPLSEEWLPAHQAAMVVLLRLVQISAELRQRGSRFLAEECLRHQARVVWNELFARIPPPEPARKWLQPMREIKLWGKYRMTRHLLREQEAGRPIPAPVAERFQVWAAEYRASVASKEQERGRAEQQPK